MGFNYIHSQNSIDTGPTGEQWNYINLDNICVHFTSGPLGVNDTLFYQLYST